MSEKKESKNYYFQLSEYLQIACNGMHSVKLNIKENNSLIGNIVIDNGKLLNATDIAGEGEEAFKRLVLNKKIEVELKHLHNKEKKKNIKINCEELIFRIFTTKDKENSLSDISKISNKELTSIEKKINKGLKMLIEKNYSDAKILFAEVAEESTEDIRVRHILKRLNEL